MTEPNNPERNLSEFSPTNQALAELLGKSFLTFYDHFTKGLGIWEFDIQGKTDFTPRKISNGGKPNSLQQGAKYIDLIAISPGVTNEANLTIKPLEELFKSEGDSTDMPLNIALRAAIRIIDNRPVLTLDTWGTFDKKQAGKFSDSQESSIGTPSTLEINTSGRTLSDLRERLDEGFTFLLPNILDRGLDKPLITSFEQKSKSEKLLPKQPQLEQNKEDIASIVDKLSKRKERSPKDDKPPTA